MVRLPKVRMPPEWGIDPVPSAARPLRTFDFFVLWSSLGVGLLVLAAGALLANLGLAELLLVAAAGSLIGSVLLAASGVVGSRYGVPSMVSLRPVLGKRGSYVPTALNVVQLIGWAAFELYIMAVAATAITGPILGPATNAVWIATIGAFCALLAVGGPLAVVRNWLRRFAIWLVYASTVALFVVVAGRLAQGGVTWFANPGAGALLLALDLVIAMPISWWPLASDYNRFARNERSGVVGTTLGYTVANLVFYVLGATMILVTRLGPDRIVMSVVVLTSGWVLLLILVDETDNAFANLYSTAVSLQNAFSRVRQWVFVVVVAVLAGSLATYLTALQEPIGGGYELFLLFIGGAFVPLLGVLVADFLLVRRGHYPIEEFYEKGPAVRLRPFLAWSVGAVVYVYLFATNLGLWTGLPTLPLGSSLPAFATSLAIHYGLSRGAATAAGESAPG